MNNIFFLIKISLINRQLNLSNDCHYLWFDPLCHIHHDPSHCHSLLSACLLPYCCVYPTQLCLTGDLHGDSRHATLWCFLHGLPLHNGEQQWQRYCLIPFPSPGLFASLATFSDLPCRSALLFLPSVLKPLLLPLPFPPLLCQTSPLECWRKSLSCLSPSHLVPDPPCPHSHPKLTWRATVRSV